MAATLLTLALLLLPGLLIVRAPWSAVPFLSCSFWIVSWWWLDLVGASRTRFLQAALAAFFALVLLRLLKPLPAVRLAWPTALVLSAGAARLLPAAFWPVAPGADMSLHALSTLLMVWRDGIPASYGPLLPIRAFGAYTPGLHALAADVALLSGMPAHRAAFVVAVLAYALLQIALYALLSKLFPKRVAALTAVIALSMARVPQGFFGWGGNTSILALAFLVAAAALLIGDSRSSALAAGLLLGAAAVTHVMIAALAVLALPVVVELVVRLDPRERRRAVGRLALAALAGLGVAAPFWWRLDFTLSPAEAGWLAAHLREHYADDWRRYASFYPLAVLRYMIATLNDAYLIACAAGLALALRRRSPGRVGLLLCVLLLLALAGTARWGGLGSVIVFPERPMAVAAIVLAVALGWLVQALVASRRGVALVALLALGAIGVERAWRYYASARSKVLVEREDLEAMAYIARSTEPLDVICNEYGSAGLWIPALAGRSISTPHLPPFYFDEFRDGAGSRRCSHLYVSPARSATVPAPPPQGAREVFRAGSVAVYVLP